MAEKRTSFTKAEQLEGSRDTMHLQQAQQHSRLATALPTQEALECDVDTDRELLRRIRRKVDLRLTLMLAVMYTFAFIDRSNLGNVNIAGAGDDLGLTVGDRYSVVTMIFFVGYLIMDIPSTQIMKKLSASIMIPTVALIFGILTIAQGFVHSWGALAALRVLLGISEGAFLPATLFLLAVWYTRFEFHKRQAGYYLVGIASSGLSGLLAYGIDKMDGTAGLEGWRWIFIIEGIASCAIAITGYFVLPDLPEHATSRNKLGLPPFLTREEGAVIVAHIERDRGDAQTEQFGYRAMLSNLKDWKVWEFGAYVMLNNTALYAFAFFLPIILQDGFGYPYSKANLLTFPPYAAALVWMAFVSWFCDHFRFRGPVMIFNSLLYIVGLCLVTFSTDLSTRYGGVFIGVIGICGNVPTNFAYQHNNTVGQSKRAMCATIMTMGGACGGIISGNIFIADEAPTFVSGISTCLAFQCVAILLVAKNFFYLKRCNRRADRGMLVIQGQPGFRYTL